GGAESQRVGWCQDHLGIENFVAVDQRDTTEACRNETTIEGQGGASQGHVFITILISVVVGVDDRGLDDRVEAAPIPAGIADGQCGLEAGSAINAVGGAGSATRGMIE